MSRHKHEEQELPFVALMDTMTNVVGVLIIVMVMVGISLAAAVNKILSDLPPVTEEEHAKMVEQLKKLPPIAEDPKKLEEKQRIVEIDEKKILDELSKIDTTSVQAQMKYMDLDSFRKKLQDSRAEREKQKAEMDKLLTELDKLKALLDQTPVYEPPAPKFVRLPNPRPYPAKPNETRILVAEQGVLTLNEAEFIKPIIEGLEKVKSQIEYKDVKIDPFAPMLKEIFGTPQAAQQAWPEIAPMVNTFQMDQVAIAYKDLVTAGLQPNKNTLSALGDIAVVIRSSLPAVTEAVIAATKGDLGKWTALDPSKDPLKPTLKATASGGKIAFVYGATGKPVEVKANPKDVLSYFVKDLGGSDAVKNKSRSKVIYDAFKIQAILERAASNPTISGSYTIKPTIKPGSTLVQLALVPRAGEKLDQMRAEGSNYQRLMRQIKGDPNGVAVFQVMSTAFDTYLESRKIADDIGVPATWEFLAKLDLAINVNGYEVQRFAKAATAPPRKPGDPDPVSIKPPTKQLD